MRGLLGIAVLLLLAWAISEDRFRVPWRLVAAGVALQFALALLLLKFHPAAAAFLLLNDAVEALQKATNAGTGFVFGYLGGGPPPFAETEPVSTYLFAFAAGRLSIETAERNGRIFRMFHRETDREKVARNRDAIFDLHAAALEWLERYTFPAEREFGDIAHAREVADFFLDELLRNGTTTALIMGSVHAASVNALFQAAAARRLRLVAGKVMMDRNCPEYLRDTPASSYADAKALIARWHGKDRLGYAITPRFAPTSSPEQLEVAGTLAREHS